MRDYTRSSRAPGLGGALKPQKPKSPMTTTAAPAKRSAPSIMGTSSNTAKPSTGVQSPEWMKQANTSGKAGPAVQSAAVTNFVNNGLSDGPPKRFVMPKPAAPAPAPAPAPTPAPQPSRRGEAIKPTWAAPTQAPQPQPAAPAAQAAEQALVAPSRTGVVRSVDSSMGDNNAAEAAQLPARRGGQPQQRAVPAPAPEAEASPEDVQAIGAEIEQAEQALADPNLPDAAKAQVSRRLQALESNPLYQRMATERLFQRMNPQERENWMASMRQMLELVSPEERERYRFLFGGSA